MDKKTSRKKRAARIRARIRQAEELHRLCIYRTPRHIYAQVISPDGASVLAAASTVEKDMRAEYGGNVPAASAVGKLIAERAKTAGVEAVAFDRSGFKYHGRVKALADAAREGGLKF
ncbi:MAG: 50S ribosomal protein L18 [Gammaproteobacteria bacterium]|nr:50S ribosomal protein L18 [Gammaproteobacteria bacterium]NNL99752.1 50S ribosomal protein L18 [Gammaproteobacteria bacterium]